MRRPRSFAAPGALTMVLVLALALSARSELPARAADTANDKPATKLKKNQVWVTPDWEARAIRSIAIAPLRSVERDAAAEALARRGLEAALAGKAYRFRPAGTVPDLVQRARADAAWAAAAAAAGKGAPLDSASARALREALSADAVFFSSVTNWQRYIVDEQTRGASFTQVGLDAALYSLTDGAIVWRGNFVEKGDGPYNEPLGGEGSTRDPSGYATGRRAVLEPPAYEEVVQKLMNRVTTALPRPAGATPASPASPAPGKS